VPVALVTGAARDRGIGRGIALALARGGFDVAVNDTAHEDEGRRRVDELQSLDIESVVKPEKPGYASPAPAQ